MLGSRGVGRTNMNVSKENMKSGTYLERRPQQVLSEKAVNHYREFTDLGGNSAGCFVDMTGHPKTLCNFSTQGYRIGLMLPVSEEVLSLQEALFRSLHEQVSQ